MEELKYHQESDPLYSIHHARIYFVPVEYTKEALMQKNQFPQL